MGSLFSASQDDIVLAPGSIVSTAVDLMYLVDAPNARAKQFAKEEGKYRVYGVYVEIEDPAGGPDAPAVQKPHIICKIPEKRESINVRVMCEPLDDLNPRWKKKDLKVHTEGNAGIAEMAETAFRERNIPRRPDVHDLEIRWSWSNNTSKYFVNTFLTKAKLPELK